MSADLSKSIELAAAALKAAGATEVYVFGSAATGAAQRSSDIDLAVRGLPAARFFKALAAAADVAGRDLDVVDLDEDSPFSRYLRGAGVLRRVA